MQLDTAAAVGRDSARIVLAVFAVGAAAAAVTMRRSSYRGALLGGAGVALGMMAWLERAAIGHAVLPTSAGPAPARCTVVVATAGAISALAAAVR